MPGVIVQSAPAPERKEDRSGKTATQGLKPPPAHSGGGASSSSQSQDGPSATAFATVSIVKIAFLFSSTSQKMSLTKRMPGTVDQVDTPSNQDLLALIQGLEQQFQQADSRARGLEYKLQQVENDLKTTTGVQNDMIMDYGCICVCQLFDDVLETSANVSTKGPRTGGTPWAIDLLTSISAYYKQVSILATQHSEKSIAKNNIGFKADNRRADVIADQIKTQLCVDPAWSRNNIADDGAAWWRAYADAYHTRNSSAHPKPSGDALRYEELLYNPRFDAFCRRRFESTRPPAFDPKPSGADPVHNRVHADFEEHRQWVTRVLDMHQATKKRNRDHLPPGLAAAP